MSFVGVVTAVTSAITGAVVSVVVVSVVVVLSVEVVAVAEYSSLSSPQEMMVKLKRKKERMTSICLTWFPISV